MQNRREAWIGLACRVGCQITQTQTLAPINELHKLQLKPWALIQWKWQPVKARSVRERKRGERERKREAEERRSGSFWTATVVHFFFFFMPCINAEHTRPVLFPGFCHTHAKTQRVSYWLEHRETETVPDTLSLVCSYSHKKGGINQALFIKKQQFYLRFSIHSYGDLVLSPSVISVTFCSFFIAPAAFWRINLNAFTHHYSYCIIALPPQQQRLSSKTLNVQLICRFTHYFQLLVQSRDVFLFYSLSNMAPVPAGLLNIQKECPPEEHVSPSSRGVTETALCMFFLSRRVKLSIFRVSALLLSKN